MKQLLIGNIISAPRFGELEIVKNGCMVVEDGKIEAILDHVPDCTDAQVSDFRDCLIMQSFADMHLHAPQYPMLGMGMDLPLLDWLNTYTFKTESRFEDAEYARTIYRELAQKLIAYGTTRVCMFSSLHTDATLILMEELENAGVTGYVGKVNMDRNSPKYYVESTETSKRETLRWLDACERFRKIRPILTPRFTPSCSDELMQWLGELARERDLPVQSHLSENLSEMEWVAKLHPDCAQYWESYHKYGLWKRNTFMAHCVHCDERERAALREHGVTVVHCADSNINLCSGVAPIRRLVEEGVHVTLGSDIAGGAQLDMFNVVQMTIRASKMKRIQTNWETDFLSVAQAYYLGTSAGAMCFGAKPGFAVGEPLHAIVVYDKDRPDTDRLSLRERFDRSVYMSDSRDIIAVFSDGIRVK